MHTQRTSACQSLPAGACKTAPTVACPQHRLAQAGNLVIVLTPVDPEERGLVLRRRRRWLSGCETDECVPGCCKNPWPLRPGSALQRTLPCNSCCSRRSSPTVRSRNSDLESSKRLLDGALMQFRRFFLCNWQV